MKNETKENLDNHCCRPGKNIPWKQIFSGTYIPVFCGYGNLSETLRNIFLALVG